jgi:DNA-directed RNA polymerase subunit K/omega
MTLGVEMGRFEFVKLAALRTAQLMRGCTPRVAVGFKVTTTAQREVADGKVLGLPRIAASPAIAVTP